MSVLCELKKRNEVGPALGWMRNTYNLTVEKVADAANIKPQHLRDIEAQTVPIRPSLAGRISACLMDLHSVDLPDDVAAETVHHNATVAAGAHRLTVEASTIEYTDGETHTAFYIARGCESVTVDLAAARRLRDELSAAITAAEAFPGHVEADTP